MFNDYEMLEACKKSPLVRLSPGAAPYSVQDLLLSKTATDRSVTSEQAIKASKELIDLQYPIINRILEIAAYLCSQNMLFIYCGDRSNIKGFNKNYEKHGHFDPSKSLIVITTELPLAQNLIHELTHATRHFIEIKYSVEFWSEKHTAFCKNQFPSFFNQAVQNKFFGDKPPNRKLLALDFFENFAAYTPEKHPEEFLSFFLQTFVGAVYHNKFGPHKEEIPQEFQKYYIDLSKEERFKLNNARILLTLCHSLPESISDEYIKGSFRVALDNCLTGKNDLIEPLIDTHWFALTEPDEKKNSFSQ